MLEELTSSRTKSNLLTKGYTVLPDLFSNTEIEKIVRIIEASDSNKPDYRKTKDLFAIRQFIHNIPNVSSLIFNDRLKHVVKNYFGLDYFLVKSIYFDKPPTSNWFVSYHQDLSISVDARKSISGYQNWTVKQHQFGVQPPLEILENIVTIRIHLDDTDKENGALKVIPGSHQRGILRPETIDWGLEKEHICKVPKGSIMIMKPLLLHSSNRTTNNKRRRVIHLEFSNKTLAKEINWKEKIKF